MAAPTFETLLYVVEDGIATITLNRPDKLNAFSTKMLQEMIAAFDETDGDDNVRCVIVTGSGKAFCAGADLTKGDRTFDYDFVGGDDKSVRTAPDGRHRDGGGLVTLRIFDSLKPVIGAINGAAAGAGATIPLAMDFRMASTKSRMAFIFTRRGLNPESASSWFLPRLVGLQQALEWTYTGRMISAEEGLAGGLYRSIHEPDDLLPAARALAREIADNSAPVAVAMARQLMWRMAGAAHPMDAHRADSRGIKARGKSADIREGIAAFQEKRAVNFPDKVSTDLTDIWTEWTPPSF